MPTYEYLCQDCDQPLEVVQSFSDETLTECPACEGTLKKVFGSIGVVFKGAGFYRTDSRDSKSSATLPAKVDSGTTDSGKTDSGKTDSGKTDSGKTDSGKSPAASKTTAPAVPS